MDTLFETPHHCRKLAAKSRTHDFSQKSLLFCNKHPSNYPPHYVKMTTTAESVAPTEAELQMTTAAAAEEVTSVDSVVIVVNEKGSMADVEKADFEKMCRICHLSPDRRLVQIGCGCKNELGTAHPHCAETWFRLRGNRCCEICGLNAKNVTGNDDGISVEEWYDNVPPSVMAQRILSERAESCWRGQPFCNFLMACLVIAFILPWFFRINMF